MDNNRQEWLFKHHLNKELILTPQFNRQKWDMTNRHGQVHFILHDWSNLKQQQKTQRFLKKDVSEPTYLYVLYFSIQTTTYSKCFIHLNNLVEMPEKKGLCFESGVATHLKKFQTVANYTEYIRTFQRHFFMNVNKVFFVEFDHSAQQCVILEWMALLKLLSSEIKFFFKKEAGALALI